jgi:hypothetical protein
MAFNNFVLAKPTICGRWTVGGERLEFIVSAIAPSSSSLKFAKSSTVLFPSILIGLFWDGISLNRTHEGSNKSNDASSPETRP